MFRLITAGRITSSKSDLLVRVQISVFCCIMFLKSMFWFLQKSVFDGSCTQCACDSFEPSLGNVYVRVWAHMLERRDLYSGCTALDNDN